MGIRALTQGPEEHGEGNEQYITKTTTHATERENYEQ